MSYAKLQTDIADWLRRKNLTARIPDFIALGETLLRDGFIYTNPRGVEITLALRVREMELSKIYRSGDSDTDAPTVDDVITTVDLPDDYLESKYILYGTHPIEKALGQTVTQDRLVVDIPRLMYRKENTIYFSPTPNALGDVELVYYRDFSGTLVSDTDTNPILTNYFNCYLYASLLSAEPFLKNDTRIPMWQSMLKNAIQAANKRESRDTRSGGRKTMGATF